MAMCRFSSQATILTLAHKYCHFLKVVKYLTVPSFATILLYPLPHRTAHPRHRF
ncbi:hypothetical protein [Nostoc sp.]|uniref:hypothetical protein n=1 Tax=Nostoc sp. TaxID=1180 RepID=UPI002FF8183A